MPELNLRISLTDHELMDLVSYMVKKDYKTAADAIRGMISDARKIQVVDGADIAERRANFVFENVGRALREIEESPQNTKEVMGAQLSPADESGWPTKIYFVKNLESRRIKIGCTTRRVKTRLSALQTSCDSKLALLGVIPSREKYHLTEEDLHNHFKQWRVDTHDSEWFQPEIEPEVLQLIQMWGIRDNS